MFACAIGRESAEIHNQRHSLIQFDHKRSLSGDGSERTRVWESDEESGGVLCGAESAAGTEVHFEMHPAVRHNHGPPRTDASGRGLQRENQSHGNPGQSNGQKQRRIRNAERGAL